MDSLAIRAGDQEFQAFCLDSDLGRLMVLDAAEGFMRRLREHVNPRDWGTLAVRAAAEAKVMRVVLDTLSDTPAAEERARNQGHLVPALVEEMAEKMWRADAERLRERGFHEPESCGDTRWCVECHAGVRPYSSLEGWRRDSILCYAKTALSVLSEKGLVP
jgi:hypothetical protein